MSTKTVILPTNVWDEILDAVQSYDDCGPEGEGWQSKELELAVAMLETALEASQ